MAVFADYLSDFGQLLVNLRKVVGNLWKIIIITMFIKNARSRDIKLNTRREIPYLCTPLYYPLFILSGLNIAACTRVVKCCLALKPGTRLASTHNCVRYMS